MAHVARDRITVDLRGAGQRVHDAAARQRITMAAFVRRTVLAACDQPLDDPHSRQGDTAEGAATKVTLRLPATHALLLKQRAQRADVSQGRYVASLIEGTPCQPWPERRESIAALMRSTDQLATLAADLRTLLRLAQGIAPAGTRLPVTDMAQLQDALRSHLDLAGRFLADVAPRAGQRPGRRASKRFVGKDR